MYLTPGPETRKDRDRVSLDPVEIQLNINHDVRSVPNAGRFPNRFHLDLFIHSCLLHSNGERVYLPNSARRGDRIQSRRARRAELALDAQGREGNGKIQGGALCREPCMLIYVLRDIAFTDILLSSLH